MAKSATLDKDRTKKLKAELIEAFDDSIISNKVLVEGILESHKWGIKKPLDNDILDEYNVFLTIQKKLKEVRGKLNRLRNIDKINETADIFFTFSEQSDVQIKSIMEKIIK